VPRVPAGASGRACPWGGAAVARFESAPAAAFGGVHAAVGHVVQAACRGGVQREAGRADARRDSHGRGREERRGPPGGQGGLDAPEGLVRVGLHDHGEFVAAEGVHVALRGLLQGGREPVDGLVTDRVAVQVVDELQFVEVRDEQQERASGLYGRAEGGFEGGAARQGGELGQARQRHPFRAVPARWVGIDCHATGAGRRLLPPDRGRGQTGPEAFLHLFPVRSG